MEIVREFRSERELTEWLKLVYNKCTNPDELWEKLVQIASTSEIRVKGYTNAYTALDLSELL